MKIGSCSKERTQTAVGKRNYIKENICTYNRIRWNKISLEMTNFTIF